MYKGSDAYEEWRQQVWKKYKHSDDETPGDVLKRMLMFYYPEAYEDLAAVFLDGDEPSYRLLPGGRVMYSAGKEGTSPYNCSVVPSPEDSMEGIFEAAGRMAKAFKSGLGVGIDISTLRPEGAIVKRGSAKISTGAWSWSELYSVVTGLVGQAHRRGALLISIDVSHPDVMKFITMKHELNQENRNFLSQLGITEDHPLYAQAKYLISRQQVRYANISIKITDKFMEAVKNDADWKLSFTVKHDNGEIETIEETVRARDIWKAIIDNMHESSEPGLLFIDRIQADNVIRDYEPVVTTNPCVTGDTWVMTDEGPRQAKELIGRQVNLLVNGSIFPTTNKGFFHTGKKPVFELTTVEGFRVRATKDHPFLVVKEDGSFEWVELGELNAGDVVLLNNHSQFDRELFRPVDTHVLYWSAKKVTLSECSELVDILEHPSSKALLTIEHMGRSNYYKFLTDVLKRYGIRTKEYVSISLSSIPALQALQRMFLRIGLYTVIDGNKLNVSVRDIEYLGDKPIGFNIHLRRSKLYTARVKDITPIGEEDVYDVEVPGINAFDANGFYVHNCGEVPLSEWGMCNLISINLPAHLNSHNEIEWEKLAGTVETAIRFADNLIDKAYYPFKEFEETAKRQRKIGLGIMGLADVFLFKQIRYGSDESVELAKEIMRFIAINAVDTSTKLAEVLGPAPAIEEYFNDYGELIEKSGFLKRVANWDPHVGERIAKYGLRNTNLISVAPTGSISILAGVSSSFEPVFYLKMKRWSDSFKKMVEYEHPAYTELKRRGVIKDGEKPDWLVTAEEIKPTEKLRVHKALQDWVDLSISNTYTVPEKISKSELEEFVMKAWEDGVKGVTIYRPGTRGAIISSAEAESDSEKEEKVTLSNIEYNRSYTLGAVSYKFPGPDGGNLYINVAGERRAPLEVFLGSKNIYPQDFVIAFNSILSMYLKDLYALSEKFDRAYYRKKLNKIIDELMEIRSHNGAIFFLGQKLYSPVGFWALALKYFRDGKTPEKELEARTMLSLSLTQPKQAKDGKVIDLYPGGLSTPPQDDAVMTKCPSCGAIIWTKEHEFEFDCNYPCPNCGYSNKCD